MIIICICSQYIVAMEIDYMKQLLMIVMAIVYNQFLQYFSNYNGNRLHISAAIATALGGISVFYSNIHPYIPCTSGSSK